MSVSAAELIHHYQLQSHPEGGYYSETYRSLELIPSYALPQRFRGARNFSTAIYFLLEQKSYSAFHRIQSDECWHFYLGGTLVIYIIYPDGELATISLGSNIQMGETFQFIVPANCWFASEPAENVQFSFVGCTVAPGFAFEDFEMAKREELINLYPQHADVINRLTR